MNVGPDEIISYVESSDPEIGGAMRRELDRQRSTIELIASENIVSTAVMAAMGSVLTNKYAEGYPGKRYYGGCDNVDEVERIAIERACKLFGSDYANVQPHSGVQANLAAYTAILKPGDRVLAMNLNQGGHLSHGSPINMSGIVYEFHFYGLDENGYLDYEELETKANEIRPRLIVAGASSYPRLIDFERISKIAKSVGAMFMADIAHIAGLVATGHHPTPIGFADVTTTTTHKTLRGPRGGMLLAGTEWQAAIDKAVFPGNQGGPLMHTIASKAVCLAEALEPSFKDYSANIVKNAAALADGLLEHGAQLVSGGTDNHLMLLDLRSLNLTGDVFEKMLDSVHITANKNLIPNDPKQASVTSGLRLGTPAATSRGFTTDDMRKIADLVYMIATDYETNRDMVASEVARMCDANPSYASYA